MDATIFSFPGRHRVGRTENTHLSGTAAIRRAVPTMCKEVLQRALRPLSRMCQRTDVEALGPSRSASILQPIAQRYPRRSLSSHEILSIRKWPCSRLRYTGADTRHSKLSKFVRLARFDLECVYELRPVEARERGRRITYLAITGRPAWRTSQARCCCQKSMPLCSKSR